MIRYILLVMLAFSANAIAADLNSLLPENPAESKSYEGENLYMMIDGGADIFFEYGFIKAIQASYYDDEGRAIMLELYEMEEPSAAFGIYTSKTGNGKKIKLGDGGLLEDYYLSFWKGIYFVTVIGSGEDEKSQKDMMSLAEAVENHMSASAGLPELAEKTGRKLFGDKKIKYVKGPLGVMNEYVFSTEDIFKVQEGLVGKIDGVNTFLFKYQTAENRADVLKDAIVKFKSNKKYSDFENQKDVYIMKDRDGNNIAMTDAGKCIIVCVGTDKDTVISSLIKKKTLL